MGIKFQRKGVILLSSLANTFIHTCISVDIPDLRQVILVRPPSVEHAIVQAMGRAGRLTASGQRAFTLTYILFNAQDCTGLPDSMVQLLKGNQCVKQCLRSHFEGTYTSELPTGTSLCCNRCDLLNAA